MKWIAICIGVIILIGAGAYIYRNYFTTPEQSINSFEECVAAGNPVMMSYPGQCSAGGQTFIEDIGNLMEMESMIRVESPAPNSTVQTPLKITGEAVGQYFFEGSFPAVLVDSDGKELGTGIMTAQGEWMTEEFVPFTGTIEFTSPATDKGTLILERNNPSEKTENDAQLIIPIKFE